MTSCYHHIVIDSVLNSTAESDIVDVKLPIDPPPPIKIYTIGFSALITFEIGNLFENALGL